MEPTLPEGHRNKRELRLDLLRAAIEIYLGLAYPGCPVPDVCSTTWCPPKTAVPTSSSRRRRTSARQSTGDVPRPSSHFASEITATRT